LPEFPVTLNYQFRETDSPSSCRDFDAGAKGQVFNRTPQSIRCPALFK
jgi:hypothetical protein